MNKILFPILSAFIFFIGFTAPLAAQITNDKKQIEIPLPEVLRSADTENVTDSRFMSEFFNMLLVLGLIVIVLYVGSWMFRRMLVQRTQQMNTSSNIKVLEQRSLSAKSALYVIDAFGKTILISESVNGVKFLSELSNDGELRE